MEGIFVSYLTNMQLGPSQHLEEFHSILVEKTNKQKSDWEILTQIYWWPTVWH